PGTGLAAGLGTRGHLVSISRLLPASGPASYDSARAAAAAADLTLFAVAVRAREGAGSIAMPLSLAELINGAGVRAMLVSFGSPYIITQVPEVSSFLIAWTVTSHSESAVAAALHGAPVTGRLPIEIPPRYRIGDGLMAGGRQRTDGRQTDRRTDGRTDGR
ncbi:MAG TPA: hypothetical protein VGA78_08495, partial [Gemmatimonadales bacterium]